MIEFLKIKTKISECQKQKYSKIQKKILIFSNLISENQKFVSEFQKKKKKQKKKQKKKKILNFRNCSQI